MHRLRAASCLPLAFVVFTAPSLHGEHIHVEVMQTHTGVRVGDSSTNAAAALSGSTSRCTANSGSYSRAYGFTCMQASSLAEATDAPMPADYQFFYDVDVIMPDQAHVVLHCSSILDQNCAGFPAYPATTSVTCNDFVSRGAHYKDCTALGPVPDGIGVYEAALQGDHVTIFGDNWERDYLNYGTWQASANPPAQTPATPAPASQTPAAQTPAAPAPASQAPAAQTSTPPAAAAKDEEPAIDPEIIIQAKAGDPVAQYKLGYHYYLGRGIAQDYAQAAVWWQKAAEQGFADAQNNLGVLYNSGKGVPQSYSEAYFWQNLAAARANGAMQAMFAKNRDDSASKLTIFARLRVQRRATQWFAKHPLPPKDAAAPGGLQETKPASATSPGTGGSDQPKPDQPKQDQPKPEQSAPDASSPPSAQIPSTRSDARS